jgi:hypothetical protein
VYNNETLYKLNIKTISGLTTNMPFYKEQCTCITEQHSLPVNVKILFQRIKGI